VPGPVTDRLRSLKRMPNWRLEPASPDQPLAPGFAALDDILRRANFDPASLLPGAMTALAIGGAQYAMPVSAAPYGLLYQPAAFAAAGLAEPGPTWTLDQFAQACAAVQTALQAKRLPTFYGALPPMFGSSTFATVTIDGFAAATGTVSGALSDGVLASAFAAGYGGWLGTGSQFDFTNPGALTGLASLVELAQTYGAPVGFLPQTFAAKGTYLNGAVMRLAAFGDFVPGARWARLPVLPRRAAVPVKLSGVQLTYEAYSGAVDPTDPGRNPPAAALEAVVQYAQWGYARAKGNPSGPIPPPVLADAAVQAGFWAAQGGGASALGDWQNYLVFRGQWPPVANVDPAATLFGALSAAAAGQDLQVALAAAERQLNTAARTFAQRYGGSGS